MTEPLCVASSSCQLEQSPPVRVLTVGLVLNPMAGVGGPAALKGSDGPEIVAQALALGVQSQVAERVRRCLALVGEDLARIRFVTCPAPMGAQVFAALAAAYPNLVCSQLDMPLADHTSSEDTRRAVLALQAQQPDLLVFAGGDGTARDVHDVLAPGQVVLGIPCGVKMHSGVFANNPESAARVLAAMSRGELVTVMRGEVRDIDERSFRQGQVITRYYGEMLVPQELRYMQQVKSGGREVEALAVEDIAAFMVEQMDADICYFIGSGSTPAAITTSLGLPSTLLGVDVVQAGALLLADAREDQLYELASRQACRMVVTAIGGQGHIFGRGNQQFSSRVIRAVGRNNLLVIATKSKLEALPGQRLLVDTGDPGLDQALTGYIPVITGYDDVVLCPVAA
ncbi:MAG: ATP-NAD kinase family protein [Pseudomonadales bacterium]|nr:ATP-NAD kinase family protein [Pseudomonadales bacterium]MDP4765765.1 ATP-NAD kinase family protein [Pseudomonadales bacterium]MDP5058123.1 ATP-NAD kinase family protein [Pseudomonadales bacterium]